MLNAGVIGMGVGEKHALAYENHKNTFLKTVCDFDHEKLKELNAKFIPQNIILIKDNSSKIASKIILSDICLENVFIWRR